MSYTGTKAQTGQGATLAINTGTVSTPTWTTIAEAIDINPSGYENKTDDATNLESLAVERVFTILDGGTWDVTGNRVSTDAGQAAAQAAFDSGVATGFQVTFPKLPTQTSVGDIYSFLAVVTKWSPNIKATKITKLAGTLATTNGVTFTEGS